MGRDLLRDVCFIIGIVITLSSLEDPTGAFVGAADFSVNPRFLLGVLFVVTALFLDKPLRGKSLESVLQEMDSQSVQKFRDVKDGIGHTKRGGLFRVGGSFYVYVHTKKEAADVANHLVGRGSEPLWRYRYHGRSHYIRTALTSTNVHNLADTYRKLLEQGAIHHRLQLEKVGFAIGEKRTAGGGQVYDRYARFEHHKLGGLPYAHYNISGTDLRGNNLHVLVVPKKKSN